MLGTVQCKFDEDPEIEFATDGGELRVASVTPGGAADRSLRVWEGLVLSEVNGVSATLSVYQDSRITFPIELSFSSPPVEVPVQGWARTGLKSRPIQRHTNAQKKFLDRCVFSFVRIWGK